MVEDRFQSRKGMSSFDVDPAGIKREGPAKSRQNWSLNTVAELVRFREEITSALPPLQLGKLNLEEENLIQYHTLKELQSSVMEDEEVPANQLAQVANAVAAVLKTLGDQQAALYTSERYKSIENLLIRHLTSREDEFSEKFLAEYRELLLTLT